MDAEKIPRESLVQSKIDKSSAKISGLGIVKNVLERFKGSFQKLDSAADFKKFSVSNSNSAAINLSASFLASPGSHSIEVQSWRLLLDKGPPDFLLQKLKLMAESHLQFR